MAVVSRLFTLLGHSIIHNPRSFARNPLLNFSKPCLLPSLRLNRPICSAVELDSETSALSSAAAVPAHPWPEWFNFVDQLKAKGYITSTAETGGDAGDESADIYRDSKLVKEACLSFARDRFDIFRSLPTSEIKAIVEKGCPSVFRKQVNSGKRLRAHLQLDEGDACSSCSLRGSCDRAYVLLNESESVARTVDVVRILLSYAVDTPVVSGDVENKALGRELIESSARRLLSALVELGETPIDPDLPKPVPVVQPKKKPPLDLSDNGGSQNIDMKPGDWVCTECSFMNFARNIKCLKCKAKGPERTYTARDVPEMKRGDWNCPQCSFMNFSKNRQCFRCQSPRPDRRLKPGDWECPACDFLNFSRNTACKKCNRERSEESAIQNGLHTWKRPY